MELWAARKGRLEQAKRALEFTEAVTRVMEWLDYEGTKCPLGGHEYGRSLEEVQKLIEEHEGFWERNVKVMEQEIDRLAEVYRGLEEGGCTELNQIRTLNAGLLRKWGVFYQDLKTRKDYLRQSMDFHKLILEVCLCGDMCTCVCVCVACVCVCVLCTYMRSCTHVHNCATGGVLVMKVFVVACIALFKNCCH